MPQGMQIRDANGVLIMDTNDRPTRILGSFYYSAAGSITDDRLLDAEPWAIVMCVAPATFNGRWEMYIATSPLYPTFSGNKMSWTWPGYTEGQLMITYGVY